MHMYLSQLFRVEIFPETASVKGDHIGAEIPTRWKLQHLVDRAGSVYLDPEAAYRWEFALLSSQEF